MKKIISSILLSIILVPSMVNATEIGVQASGTVMVNKEQRKDDKDNSLISKLKERIEDRASTTAARKAAKDQLDATKLACVGTAVGVREDAIIAANDTFSASIKAALATRSTSLKTAWTISTSSERMAAQKTATKAFNKSVQAAHDAMRKARVSAWNTFSASAKTCGVPNTGEKPQMVENPTYSY